MFSDMDFLGWYTTGDVPTDSDIHVHRQVPIVTYVVVNDVCEQWDLILPAQTTSNQETSLLSLNCALFVLNTLKGGLLRKIKKYTFISTS